MASIMKIPAYIVMPRDAPISKKRAVLNYKGQIVECGPTVSEREKTLADT